MGSGTWTDRDWGNVQQTTAGRTTAQIFTSSNMPKDFDPKTIKLRESRDSADHPNSTPIILALDGTGSMGEIAGILAREGLGKLVGEILERKPVTDPQIMAMCVGDAYSDSAPLQATQFESDIRIAKQLTELYLEQGGGGNDQESYNLPHYFAATKTEIDCFTKRWRKGVIITIGDEPCPPVLEGEHIREFIDPDYAGGDISTVDVLAMAQQKYDVFHLVVEQTSYAISNRSRIYKSWNAVLPEGRVIPLKDHTKVAEVVVSLLEAFAGKDKAQIANSWGSSKSTALVVAEAIKSIVPQGQDGDLTVWRPGKVAGGRSGR